MNFLKKKVLPILLACIVVLLAAVPQISVFAEKGTLGTENPVWKASFLDSDGNAADGNSLLAGEYTVNLNLYGMKTISVLQISATYTDAVTVNSCKTIAQSKSALFRDIIKKENDNEFDAVVAAYNSDSVITAVDIADGETMVSLNITVNTPGDFANYFSLNTDPERTYIGADLGDGYDSAYTCVESADVQAPSDRKYYPNITHDMSPDISVKTYDVKGQITIATNLDGTAGTTGIVGITASVAVGDKTVTATTDSQGYYTLSALSEGTYTVTFSGSTTVDRTATLVVSADKADSNGLITVSAVPICICDYVKNGEIDGFDKINFMKYLTNDEYDVYHDIVANSKVDGFDKVQFQSFLNQKIVYAQAEL